MAALFALSSIPDDEPNLAHRILILPPQWHNAVHVPAYALLAWLWWRALRIAGWRAPRAILAGVVVATIYGALDELHQYFVPGRFLSVTDGMLNLLGATLTLGWVRWTEWNFGAPARPTSGTHASTSP